MILNNLYKSGARHFQIPDTLPSGKSDEPTPVNARFSFINASRDIIGENFFSGVMDFHIRNPMYRWIKPADCGFKLRLSYSYKDKQTGLFRPIRMSDGIALAQDVGSQMFQSVDWQIDGQSIARITRDMPQIAAMFRRLDQTQNHIRAVGNTLNLESHLFYERQKQTAIDGGVLALSKTPVKLPFSNYVGNIGADNNIVRVSATEITSTATGGADDLLGLYKAQTVANADSLKENGQAIQLSFQYKPAQATLPAPAGGGFSGIGYGTAGEGIRAFFSQVDVGDFVDFDSLIGTNIRATDSPIEINLGTDLIAAAAGATLRLEAAGAGVGQAVTLTLAAVTNRAGTNVFNILNTRTLSSNSFRLRVKGHFTFDTASGNLFPGEYPIRVEANADKVLAAGGAEASFTIQLITGNFIFGKSATTNTTNPFPIPSDDFFRDELSKLTLIIDPNGYSYNSASFGLGIRPSPLEIIRKLPPRALTGVAGFTEQFTLFVRCNDPVYKQKLLGNVVNVAPVGLQILKRDLDQDCKDTWREAELFFKLPLHFFYLSHMLPGIPMTFQLQPFQKQQFIRGLFETTQELDTNNIDVRIENMEFMMFTVDGPDFQNKTFNLDLRTMNMHPLSTVRNDSLTSLTFSISPSTEGLAVAFQTSKVDQSSLYSKSDFKFYRSVGKDVDSYDYVRHLSRFWINYGDSTFPNTPMDPMLFTGRDRLAVDWMETMMQTGLYFGYDPETYQDWKQKGMYFFYQVARPKNARNTDVTVNIQFERKNGDPSEKLTDADFSNLRVMVFDIVRSACQINISNGRVVGVDIQEIS